MGYTTTFQGVFQLSKLPSAETIVALRQIEMATGRDVRAAAPAPDSYCQWRLTKNCQGIEWDRGEKFYEYIEWLQWIIDQCLKPEGIELSGSVKFDGEDSDDFGYLKIVDGKVIVEKANVVNESLEELIDFKNFVLKHDDAGGILREWLRRKKARPK